MRSNGASGAWTNSSILLQSLSAPEKLGRVLALDYALALMMDAFAALFSGALQDDFQLSPEQTSLTMAAIGFALVLPWIVYHGRGGGVADDTKMALEKGESPPSEKSPLLRRSHV